MKIKVCNSFLLLLALSFAINAQKIFLLTVLACTFHEFGHLFFIKTFGCRVSSFKISAVGGKIESFDLKKLSSGKLLLVYISGIFINFVLGFLSYQIAIIGFYSYNFFLFSGINYILGLFNLIPIRILDGGHILNIVLSFFISTANVDKICIYTSFIFNVSLILFGAIFSLKLNFSILIVSMFLLFKELSFNSLRY